MIDVPHRDGKTQIGSIMTKNELVSRFIEIAPFLADLENFGWVAPVSGSVYEMYDTDQGDQNYKPFKVDITAGTHTNIVYYENGEAKYIEGTM